MQLLAVGTYDDPTISVFDIFDDRFVMEEPLDFVGMHGKLLVYFYDSSGKAVQPEPRIGQLRLQTMIITFDK